MKVKQDVYDTYWKVTAHQIPNMNLSLADLSKVTAKTTSPGRIHYGYQVAYRI